MAGEVLNGRLDAERHARALADSTSIRPEQAAPLLERAGSEPLAHAMRITEVARRQNVSLDALFEAVGVGMDIDRGAVVSTELEIKYAGYLERERVQAEKIKRMGDFVIPEDLDFSELDSLAFEARHKLAAIRPRTLAQVSRISGVSPSDVQNLVIEVEKRRKRDVSA